MDFEIKDRYTPSLLPPPVNDNVSPFRFIDLRKDNRKFYDLTKGNDNGKEKN